MFERRRTSPTVFALLAGVMAIHGMLVSSAANAQPPSPPDLPAPPAGFTSFEFEGAPDQAALLSSYLWYHFHLRGGNGPVLFNKEYLTLADLWLNEARPRGDEQLIQALHRAHLLEMEIDPEGYVNTHQHFSHAHDLGWPFPLWTQSATGPQEILGNTAGWHFQPLEAVPGWVGDYLRGWNEPRWHGEGAVAAWTLENASSGGLVENRWRIQSTAASAALISPEDVTLDAFQAPFVQIRWSRSGTVNPAAPPYLEWQREDAPHFDSTRRMHFYPEETTLSRGNFHSILPLHQHPEWRGRITRLRIVLAPGESDTVLDVDSIFTVYDTRHTINNPIFILASSNYFEWTGDLVFLREQINRLRMALRYQRTELGGLSRNCIRVTWPGHDGRPGYSTAPDGAKTLRPGHGIGNNYWDIMPFGWDDFYATCQYYAATRAMSEIEQAILDHPQWNIPRGTLALDPDALREHAESVKVEANQRFWNETTARFYSAKDADGVARDYGHTFVNLDAIWYDIANDEHGRAIMDWISGARVIEGDTSQGSDIYKWRFGPRATTLRNLEWYGQGWNSPESLAFGDQVQDGGAVLGFTFHDLWARLRLIGADNAWQRLMEILAWEAEVREAGGYRAYYAPEHARGSLQGGGTPGGLGIDHEFYESSLLPAIIPYGFLGLSPTPAELVIAPRLPSAVPSITVRNLRYKGVAMDITARAGEILIALKSAPVLPLKLRLEEGWSLEGASSPVPQAEISDAVTYRFYR